MGEMIGNLDNKTRREASFFGINVFNYRNLFSMIRLNGFVFTLSISIRNYY